MGIMQNVTIGISGLALALSLGGCESGSLGGCESGLKYPSKGESEPRYFEGVVVKETEMIRSRDITYVLTLDTKNGRYFIEVCQYGKSLMALAEAIEVGDRVRIITDTDFGYSCSSDKIGRVGSKSVEVLKE